MGQKRKRILVKKIITATIVLSICTILVCVLFFYGNKIIHKIHEKTGESLLSTFHMDNALSISHPEWTENFLTPNKYSRPGTPLGKVKNIFVHYTANPGTTAKQNRNYFEQLKDTRETSASSHFIIDYEGKIIQCIPLDEIAYAVMTRNEDSISIECCYVNEDGSFSDATYDSLVSLLKWLVAAYQLDTEDILRHYDCGGKKCPLYYVENESAWEQLKEDIKRL